MRYINENEQEELQNYIEEEIQEELQEEEKKISRRMNREYRIVSIFFGLIFLSLAGYLMYFCAFQSDTFINSPYNTRQDSFSERVVKGKILASGGEVLAETRYDGAGEEYRYYPYGRMFSHVVGYDIYGKSGLELQGNFELLNSHDFFLNQIKNQFQNQKNIGDSLVTSLDVNLQTAAYNALGDHKGAVVVIEPSTGRILAMVSKNDFDPNSLGYDWENLIADEDNSSLLNRATSGLYPPGSTFKIVTTLAFFKKYGNLDNFHYNCEGMVTVGNKTLQCYNKTVHGKENLRQAFAYSCNSAFSEIGVNLGAVKLRETAESLLFNKKISLDFPARRNSFSLKENASTLEIMHTAMGQGETLVSPLFMAMLTSAIANKGVIMKPSLIDGINNDSGDNIRRIKPQTYKTIMTDKEAAALKGIMQEVVEYGTATSLGGRGYTVAGKTGSAEIDSEGHSHSWFVGFSNVEHPDIVVSIIVEYGGTGSESAVPIAGSIFETYYLYKDKPQEKVDNNTANTPQIPVVVDPVIPSYDSWYNSPYDNSYQEPEQPVEQPSNPDVVIPLDPNPVQPVDPYVQPSEQPYDQPYNQDPQPYDQPAADPYEPPTDVPYDQTPVTQPEFPIDYETYYQTYNQSTYNVY